MSERVALFLRTRRKPALPAGYQFGDASVMAAWVEDDIRRGRGRERHVVPDREDYWRGWNVIEGEEYE